MKITIEMGCLAKPLHEQLGISPIAAKPYQQMADAISLLGLKGILTDREKTRARDRLFKKIEKLCR